MNRDASPIAAVCLLLATVCLFLAAPAPNTSAAVGDSARGDYPRTHLPEVPPTDTRPEPERTRGPEATLFPSAQIIAIVGKLPILAGDVVPQADRALQPQKDKAPPEEFERQRKLLVQQMLKQVIDRKIVYLDFLRNVPTERIPEIEKQCAKQFNKAPLEDLMKRAKVSSVAELDAKLREAGSSLAKQRQAFCEQIMGNDILQKNIDREKEVSHDDRLEYYREHIDDYRVETKVRWEQLMVRFDRFPSKTEAYRALADMGNQVLRGVPLAVVAKQSSQGFNASKGGQHDWTGQGSLKSTVLDEAIFSLPVGRVSQIIPDDEGFHVVRVIERTEQGVVPFVEAQVEIKKKIQKKQTREQIDTYLARLRKDTRVWTIFDDGPAPPHVSRQWRRSRPNTPR